MVGQTVSHNCVIDKPSEGGMDVAHFAEEVRLGRRVVVNTAQGRPNHYAFLKSLSRETRAASILPHQHIPINYDDGKTDDGKQCVA